MEKERVCDGKGEKEGEGAKTRARENESEMGCEVELPLDMIFEILTRSSLDTLEQCDVVSKQWKEMLHEPTFLQLHCRRSNCIFGYFFHDIAYGYESVLATMEGDWSWNLCCNGMKILASSDNGIMCCERLVLYNNRYYVCKPATKQWQGLPNPKLRFRTAAVAVVVSNHTPLHYKIVRLSKSFVPYLKPMSWYCMEYNCEIFDSETWAWESTRGPTLSSDDFIFTSDHVVTIGQFVYWLTYNYNVVAFNINTKCFKYVSLPESCKSNYGLATNRLQKYEGRLGFTSLKEDQDKLELWVVGSRLNEWTMKMVVDMSIPGKRWRCPDLVEFCNSCIVFMATDDEAMFYNHQDHTFRRVEVPCRLKFARQIFRLRSDMKTVNLKGGQE